MSKIGILSFPRYFNYGTFLQLYALQTVVAECGYEPEVIDYDPYNDSLKKPVEQRTLAGALKQLLSTLVSPLRRGGSRSSFTVGQAQQRTRFVQFLADDIRLGEKTYFSAQQLEADPPAADAFIVGSDQVWNPVGHYQDSAYFLSFAEQAKRIAYAPSFGVSELPQDTQDWLKEQINAIPYLSIREEAGAAMIESLTGRTAQVVLDPAYLLDADAWSDFADEAAVPEQPYLLCYFLESDRYMREQALALAEQQGLRPLLIPVHPCDEEGLGDRFIQLSGIGPREFVGLIRHAAFICTDSFHGTSFSILFNRPFLTFKRYDNAAQAANHSRLDSILQATGLQHRIADKNSAVEQWGLDIDFSHANGQVQQLREESMRYLRGVLKAVTSRKPRSLAS